MLMTRASARLYTTNAPTATDTPRYASAVGCWNRDFVCNCTEGNMLNRDGRRVHRIHIGRYEDFIGNPHAGTPTTPKSQTPYLPRTRADTRFFDEHRYEPRGLEQPPWRSPLRVPTSSPLWGLAQVSRSHSCGRTTSRTLVVLGHRASLSLTPRCGKPHPKPR